MQKHSNQTQLLIFVFWPRSEFKATSQTQDEYNLAPLRHFTKLIGISDLISLEKVHLCLNFSKLTSFFLVRNVKHMQKEYFYTTRNLMKNHNE